MIDPRLRALLPLFAAVFIDIFSFGLMYPVIIALFHDPEVVGVYRPAVLDAYLSLAFSLFPLGMFFGASYLGDLSDALGRRRTLLICMAGLATAYVLMWLAVETQDLLFFLAGRLLSGLMAGTGPIAQAAMMDRSSEAERGRNMSNVVLVNCVGLVTGPAVGGGLAHWDFRAPLGFAFALCLLAFLWIWRSHVIEAPAGKPLALSWHRPIEIFLSAIRHPVIGPIALSYLLFQLGFALYYVYILVEMQKTYHATSLELGLFSAVLGVGFVIGTTVGYRAAAAWLKSDAKVAAAALIACGIVILLAALPSGRAASGAGGPARRDQQCQRLRRLVDPDQRCRRPRGAGLGAGHRRLPVGARLLHRRPCRQRARVPAALDPDRRQRAHRIGGPGAAARDGAVEPPQCTAAYMIFSSVASAGENSSTMRPWRQTRMRSERFRISGR